MTTGAHPEAVASTSKVRRIATIAFGYTLVGGGAVLLFLPGPGAPLVLAGLAVLGREQPWARRVEARMRAGAAGLMRRLGFARFGAGRRPCEARSPAGVLPPPV